MSMPTDEIQKVFGPQYRAVATMLIVLAALGFVALNAISMAERAIDSRIDGKLAAQKQESEAQAKRLEKVEEQFAAMRDTLSEIRADVRVLRATYGREEMVPVAAPAVEKPRR